MDKPLIKLIVKVPDSEGEVYILCDGWTWSADGLFVHREDKRIAHFPRYQYWVVQQ